MIASAIIERMQRKLDYAQAEVEVLKEQIKIAKGSSRLIFCSPRTDADTD